MGKNVINDIKIDKMEIKVNDKGHTTNCYYISDKNGNLVLIDPAADANGILKEIEKQGLYLKAIIVTHVHADHTGAIASIIARHPNVKVYIHKEDAGALNNEKINCQENVGVQVPLVETNKITSLLDEQSIKIRDMDFKIIHTPGHTKGSICILEKTSNVLFTGDTIFANTYGRTDLQTGNSADMYNSLEKIFNTFDDIMCFAGHGEEFVLENVKKKIKLLFSYKEGEI